MAEAVHITADQETQRLVGPPCHQRLASATYFSLRSHSLKAAESYQTSPPSGEQAFKTESMKGFHIQTLEGGERIPLSGNFLLNNEIFRRKCIGSLRNRLVFCLDPSVCQHGSGKGSGVSLFTGPAFPFLLCHCLLCGLDKCPCLTLPLCPRF